MTLKTIAFAAITVLGFSVTTSVATHAAVGIQFDIGNVPSGTPMAITIATTTGTVGSTAPTWSAGATIMTATITPGGMTTVITTIDRAGSPGGSPARLRSIA